MLLDRPYFGRIDFRPTNESVSDTNPDETEGPTQRIYIGINIPAVDSLATGIYSWMAPVAELWYNPNYEDAGYTAPKGHIRGKLDLKRHIKIRDGELEEVNEMFRRQLPAADDRRMDMLTEALSGTGDEGGHLQIIVETIEPEQYQSIANVRDKVLIVQGAAGSGKSEIGLHRIAYLLSPFNGIAEAERPTPSTTQLVHHRRSWSMTPTFFPAWALRRTLSKPSSASGSLADCLRVSGLDPEYGQTS